MQLSLSLSLDYNIKIKQLYENSKFIFGTGGDVLVSTGSSVNLNPHIDLNADISASSAPRELRYSSQSAQNDIPDCQRVMFFPVVPIDFG